MSKATNNTRTANDTATREEVTAVSTLDATAAETFVRTARERGRGFHAEARDYVAAVDARGGKRGADAAVQRVIGDAVRGAGFDPYSHSRYSKLAAAFRALGKLSKAGVTADDAETFDALYALWNVPSSKLDATARDAIVAAAGRKRTADAARAAIVKATADALTRKAEAPASDSDSDTPADSDSDADVAPAAVPAPVPATADDIMDAIAALYAIAAEMSDADRVRIAAALSATADSLTAAAVPADASALTAAA